MNDEASCTTNCICMAFVGQECEVHLRFSDRFNLQCISLFMLLPRDIYFPPAAARLEPWNPKEPAAGSIINVNDLRNFCFSYKITVSAALSSGERGGKVAPEDAAVALSCSQPVSHRSSHSTW